MIEPTWQAQWIWSEGESSPRNEWRCFRRTFEVPHAGWDEASIRITADSRYVLMVNGQHLGRGPVRSWPFEQAYDTYEIGHLLLRGQQNTIAVFVQHFGVSTFYYLRGRGGLLAQLELVLENKSTVLLITDSTWMTSKHLGHHSRAPRMSCQQAFSEYVDASLWNEDWVLSDYDDSSWDKAAIVGPAGVEPWTTLKKRDIPLLTEEVVYPVRVESLNQVKSFTWSTAIDLRNHMLPGSEDHANRVGFTGYIAVLLTIETPTSILLGFTHSGECLRQCALNGRIIEEEAFYGIQPEKYVQLELQQGDNLLLIDVTSEGIHTGKLHLGIYSDSAVGVRSPLSEEAQPSPFITIGPFDTAVYIDHQEQPILDVQNETYKSVLLEVKSTEDLSRYQTWLRRIDASLVSEADVLSLCIWKKESIAHNVPAAMQNMVIAHQYPAVVPIFTGYDTELVVDFGKEYSGYLSFEVEADEGTVLDLYGFEYMLGDYRQDTFNLDNTLRYVCKKGRQCYVSPIRRGLRYLMVTVRNASAAAKIFDVHILQSNYPIAEIGNFHCSDALLNDIWQISQHTTKLCMEDTFVDCPAFEQVFWVGDSRNEALVSNYLYGVNDIVKRCLRLVPGSKKQTPLYANQVPSGWSSVIPNWTFFWAIACYEYYQQTGDRAFAQEMYPHIRYTLEHYQQKINANGLLDIKGWNLLDWSPMDQPNDGIVTHQNMFLMKTFVVAAEMAALAGDEAGVKTFAEAGDTLQHAINKHLWCNEKQAYIDCIHTDGRRSNVYSMQTQVVGHLTGAASGERKQQIEQYLLQPPPNFVQIGTPFMSFFHYETLAEAGRSQEIVDDIRKNYGQMIQYGATTCWEMYPNFAENRVNPDMLTRSHCHAWSAAPAYFLGTEVLGIRRSAPGWKEVTVAPNPCGLAWARGSVPLPERGRIDVSWQADEANQSLKVKIKHPKDVQVTVILPGGYRGEVELSEI
jgi:alpha-L-rhamnosidase